MNKKIVVVYIDNMERLSFYERFKSDKFDIKYITFSLQVKIKSKRETYLIRGNSDKYKSIVSESDIIFSNMDSSLFSLDEDKINKVAVSVLVTLDKINSKLDDKICLWIWNGTNTVGNVFRLYREINENVETLFFEITNLPNSIFCDPDGVNAQSRLYHNPNYLRHSAISQFDYNKWVDEYKKFKSSPPKQAENKSKLNFFVLFDLFTLMSNIPNLISFKYKLTSLYRKLQRTQVDYSYIGDVKVNKKKGMIFLPLQVSNDSQVIINSDYDNYNMIKIGLSTAKKDNLDLVVKLHPAEINFDYLEGFDQNAFILSNEKTEKLLEDCSYVLVNNSTVGLEALIYNKRVEFRGRTIYANFSHFDLKCYVSSHIVKGIDYFSSEVIQDDAILIAMSYSSD
ncbi:hypothetical protein AB6D04_10930 [Vibrio splendidus]|uniref:capsular polysaccharide export protein, LipB/KpsS family n=1 Tax=Vibrio splendidus TaxID=29497 RepID=UPI000C827DAC|nr:hypothetical protein [Vibrio splendidus]PMN78449.1 hypothetical protein BCT24_04505 [Vibrio splendidus]